jgi:hypothetical protein
MKRAQRISGCINRSAYSSNRRRGKCNEAAIATTAWTRRRVGLLHGQSAVMTMMKSRWSGSSAIITCATVRLLFYRRPDSFARASIQTCATQIRLVYLDPHIHSSDYVVNANVAASAMIVPAWTRLPDDMAMNHWYQQKLQQKRYNALLVMDDDVCLLVKTLLIPRPPLFSSMVSTIWPTIISHIHTS